MAENGGIVVTGASTGIGESCARALHDLGFTVFAGVRKDADAQRMRDVGSDRLRPVMLDVTKAETIAAAKEEVAEALGDMPLMGLVNNAGINVSAPLEFVPLDDLRWQLEVNVVGQVAVTQAFLPMLRKSKGRIVNIGSTSGFFPAPLQGAYCASKHAMEAITNVFRIELKPWGIHVAIVDPGAIKTPIWDKSLGRAEQFLGNAPKAMHELYGGLIEKVRDYARNAPDDASPPEVVAGKVVHALTSPKPKAQYVVGQNARAQWVLSHLPAGIREYLTSKEMSL